MRLICLITALYFACQVHAQERMQFHHFTTKDGLSSNSVLCIYQDRKGFIWIGTDGGGLNRFDGYHFTQFLHHEDDSQSISNNQICSIIEDHQGFLWVATANGLNRYDPNSGHFKRFYHIPGNPKSLLYNKVTFLCEDSENTLWVGTLMGLHKYEAASETFANYYSKMTVRDQRPDKEISSIIDDRQGNLWLGTWWGGLKKFNKKTEQFTDFYADVKDPNSLRNNNVLSLYLDNQNILWIGNYMGGIRKLNIISEKYIPITDPEKDANIMGICCDQTGRIWYSRTGVGIIQPNSQSVQLLDYDKARPLGINSGTYFPILCDNTGIVWLGSEHGISMYDSNREKFSLRNPTGNKEHYKIEKFYFDNENNTLWLGTSKDGLIKYNEDTRQVKRFLTDKTLNDRFFDIQTLYRNKNHLWIGTGNGIGVMDTKTEKVIKVLYNNTTEPTLANRVYGNDEFMWFINNNVRILDLARQKEYEFPASGALALPCQRITAVINDNDSNLWIGTYEGLARYNYITQTLLSYYNQFSDTASISDKCIFSIFQDSKKNIWIGTKNGLNRYNGKSNNFDRFSRNESFASNYILNIKEDKHQNLWLFTDKGITKFNPNSGLVKNYNESDGLDFGGQVISDKNGLFYCNGRTEDYFVFQPDSIKDNPIIPPVYITRFLLFNKDVPVSDKTHKTPLITNISETKEITLKHDQSFIGFEFLALNYTLPEKNKYVYQMVGFDQDWYFADASQRSVTYTNMNPGTYVFRVKASNNDGLWNEKGTEIKILILPPLWKTWWAYIIYFFMIAGLIYLFRSYVLYQYQLKAKIDSERMKAEKTHEIDQMKLDFFGNVSHEFRTPLTLISGPLDYLIERKSELNWEHDNKYFNLMKRNTDRLLHLINKVLDIRKLDSGFLDIHLKNDDIIQFVNSLTGSFDFKAAQKKIRFNKVFHQETYHTWFDPDVIDKIVFNLLSNALKFTPDDGEVSIDTVIFESGSEQWISEKELHGMETSADLIKIIVKDSGIGIPPEQQEKIFDRFYQADNRASRSGGSGIGLALVKELVELVDGKVKVESEVEVGSCFTIWIPIGENTANSEHLSKIHTTITNPLVENEALNVQHKSEHRSIDSEEVTEKPLILIVEDNQDMQLFVSNILQNDFETLTANNGKIGFELAREYIPDLVVSDIMMPDMDGMEMCQLIRGNERTNHIPVVMLTARSTEEYQIEGLFAGADDYIMKPFSAKNLLLRVANIIKSRQLLREKFSLADFSNNSSKANSVDDAFVNKIRGIVEKHIDNPDFDPQLFASEVGMSRAQFYRKLKAVTNQSVNDFIFSVRINVAVKLMLTDNLSISETAYAVGFKTPAHFSKIFSNHMSMSPSKYIELHRKK